MVEEGSPLPDVSLPVFHGTRGRCASCGGGGCSTCSESRIRRSSARRELHSAGSSGRKRCSCDSCDYGEYALVDEYSAPAPAVPYAVLVPIEEVPVPQIQEQTVEATTTIPQERVSERTAETTSAELGTLLCRLSLGTPGSSRSASAPVPAPDSAVRIKRRQEVESALAKRAAQELLQEEEIETEPASKKARKGKHKS